MEITPQLDEQDKMPLYMQLYHYFKMEIQTSRLTSSTRLPSIRQLAADLNVSKTTVRMAYEQLLDEGYIESRERSGFFVEEMEEEVQQITEHVAAISCKEEADSRQPLILFDFYMSSIDLNHFPFDSWRRYTNQYMHSNHKELLSYGDPQGEAGLRLELCRYLRQSRGVNCSPEQIVLGSGTQTMIYMLCQLIGLDGSEIALEEPGYQNVRRIFEHLGFRTRPIPLEMDGMNIDELSKTHAKAVYITPSHQYPLGMVMPIVKRTRLLRWANENNAVIIEDDYDGEFRYRGKPIPALQGLDTNGTVVYVGTFSKSLLPAVRISYMVLPSQLLDEYQKRLSAYDQTVSRLHQQTLQAFMANGDLERHVRKMRKIYKQKHHVLLQSIKMVMEDHVEVTGQDAGLHIVIKVNSTLDADELVEIAQSAGVRVYSTTDMWLNKPNTYPPMILLGFGGLSIEEIQEGIHQLHAAWKPYYQ